LDSISVLNRILKHDHTKTPYQEMRGKQIDWLRDLHVEWGEPVLPRKLNIDKVRFRHVTNA
jgi:hypothetical protein